MNVHQLRAGHWGRAESYLHRIGRRPTTADPGCSRSDCPQARCTVCREEAGSPAHVLFRCPSVAGARLRLLGTIYSPPQAMRNNGAVAALASVYLHHKCPWRASSCRWSHWVFRTPDNSSSWTGPLRTVSKTVPPPPPPPARPSASSSGRGEKAGKADKTTKGSRSSASSRHSNGNTHCADWIIPNHSISSWILWKTRRFLSAFRWRRLNRLPSRPPHCLPTSRIKQRPPQPRPMRLQRRMPLLKALQHLAEPSSLGPLPAPKAPAPSRHQIRLQSSSR